MDGLGRRARRRKERPQGRPVLLFADSVGRPGGAASPPESRPASARRDAAAVELWRSLRLRFRSTERRAPTDLRPVPARLPSVCDARVQYVCACRPRRGPCCYLRSDFRSAFIVFFYSAAVPYTNTSRIASLRARWPVRCAQCFKQGALRRAAPVPSPARAVVSAHRYRARSPLARRTTNALAYYRTTPRAPTVSIRYVYAPAAASRPPGHVSALSRPCARHLGPAPAHTRHDD